ncbi:MAG: hypothetical protein ABI668_15260 [Sphingorhabdus sp.]
MNHKFFSIAISSSIITLISGSYLDKSKNMNERVESIISRYFPHEDQSKALHCIMAKPNDDIRGCIKDKAIFRYKNPQFQNSPTMLDFLWVNRHETGFTPQKMSALILSGASPKDIATNVILESEPEYFAAFVEAAGGPNALNDLGWGDGSIMHAAVAYWDDAKINHLATLGANWEQKSPLAHETAVLVARRSGAGASEFERINRLLDLGANPRALDKWGTGLCDFIATGRSTWDDDGSQRAALKKRLKDEFLMEC